MEKFTKSPKWKTNGMLTSSFREFATKILGKLDTATSFMYLYRRFGEPNRTNKDEYSILYEYGFKHEDILFTIHASYHEHVYFSLYIPEKRFQEWRKKRKLFWRNLYKKYKNGVFLPYAEFPYTGIYGLTKLQNSKNFKFIDKEGKAFFTLKDDEYITAQFKSGKIERKCFNMLEKLSDKLCADFRAKLTEEELKELNQREPKIEDITGLKEQCLTIVDELRRGFFVRDVAINIIGYESKDNVICEYENREES